MGIKMTAPVGRPPGQGKVLGSGRRKGGLDKNARLLITEAMAADILKVYKRLGKDWLFKVAQERPDLFINQCLSRLLPPPIKEDPDVLIQQQFSSSNLSDRDIAVRVAFALSKGVQAIEPPMTPQQACQVPRWQSPDVMPDTVPLLIPEPTTDPERQKWIDDLHLTDEQRRDKALIEQTKTGVCWGSAKEQGLSPAQRRRRDQLL